MTRREAWLTAGGLFLIALVVRSIVASAVPFPTPEDTAYYYGVARNLVEGRGLVSDAIWSFGTPPLEFPRPAFEVWRSEERRVGKECYALCRSRWSPYH